ADDINGLLEYGFRYFILNNPGHFAFFRNVQQNNIILIAGPWLYAYNSWALSFLKANNAAYFVSAPENNRQNLERTLLRGSRQQAFVTVYSRPTLFRIRGNLGGLYSFKKFRDSQDEGFMLTSANDDTTNVYPERYFYIADKIPFLRESGFRRFIYDMSSEPVNKNDYRELMKAADEAAVARGASRFNWKDGFYREPEKPAGS
ncbi:MAG: U32 family peptidase, partial [Treponema sp.]|nr:U32 family peptidase [Treponema sp.]